jgi:lipid-A-disaccharide synthase
MSSTTAANKENQVMIVAAEASSSLFALRLLEHWKKEKKQIHAFGVGSNDMEALGFERLGKSEEMAVVGAAEIAEHFGKLRAVFNSLVAEAERRRPQVIIVMDYPEFNLMLSKKLHALGLNVVYYVSPQVWAWRRGRVNTIKKYCRKVLVLFNFEVPFYEQKGVPVEFVGHPILDELNSKYFDPAYRKTHRNRCGIEDEDIVIGLMPGSRRLELKMHLPLQLEVARRLYTHYPRIKVLLMCAPTVDPETLKDQLGDLRYPLILQKDDPYEMMNLCDYILAASGTATLMVGLMEKPMVIMYRMKWLTGVIAKLVVRGVKYFGLPNLILGGEVVPERWQGGANADELFALMKKYIDDPLYTAQVRQDLARLKNLLGDRGATARAAQALEEYFQS